MLLTGVPERKSQGIVGVHKAESACLASARDVTEECSCPRRRERSRGSQTPHPEASKWDCFVLPACCSVTPAGGGGLPHSGLASPGPPVAPKPGRPGFSGSARGLIRMLLLKLVLYIHILKPTRLEATGSCFCSL